MSLSPSRKPGRQRHGVGVVELDPQGAAVVADRDRPVEASLADPQVVEQPQRLPGEVAELRVVALALQLGDDDDGQDDLVLLEPVHRPRVRQQDRGVEDVRLAAMLVRRGWPASDEVVTALSGLEPWCSRGLRGLAPGRSARLLARSGWPCTGGAGPGPPFEASAHRGLRAGDGCLRCSTVRRAGFAPLGRVLSSPGSADAAEPPAEPPGRVPDAHGGHASRGRDGRPEAPVPAPVPAVPSAYAQGPEEVDVAEVGPVGLAEVELRRRALPEEEAAEPLLPDVRMTRSGRAGPWCRGARRCPRRR